MPKKYTTYNTALDFLDYPPFFSKSNIFVANLIFITPPSLNPLPREGHPTLIELPCLSSFENRRVTGHALIACNAYNLRTNVQIFPLAKRQTAP